MMTAEMLLKVAVSLVALGILYKASFNEDLGTAIMAISGVALGAVAIVTAIANTYIVI